MKPSYENFMDQIVLSIELNNNIGHTFTFHYISLPDKIGL